jgi:hypothetical protein
MTEIYGMSSEAEMNGEMNEMQNKIHTVLADFLSEIMARSILNLSIKTSNVTLTKYKPEDGRRLFRELEKGVRIYIKNDTDKDTCVDRLSELLLNSVAAPELAIGAD